MLDTVNWPFGPGVHHVGVAVILTLNCPARAGALHITAMRVVAATIASVLQTVAPGDVIACLPPHGHVSWMSNVWSLAPKEGVVPLTTPVITRNCWLGPVSSYQATGNVPAE